MDISTSTEQIRQFALAIKALEDAKLPNEITRKTQALINKTNILRGGEQSLLNSLSTKDVLKQAKVTLESCQARELHKHPPRYHGVLTTQEAADRLKGCEVGTWFLYFNETFHSYVVGSVQDNNHISHMRTSSSPDTFEPKRYELDSKKAKNRP